MFKHLQDVCSAIEYIAYIEERLWGGRPVLWDLQATAKGVGDAKTYLHMTDIELKDEDQLIGSINLSWFINIDLNDFEPRARYEFVIAFKSVGGDMPIRDHLKLHARYYTLDRQTSVCDLALLKYVEQWKNGLKEFAREADWRALPDENGENQQRVHGTCSPADDRRFAIFLGQMLFDEIAKVPRPTGI